MELLGVGPTELLFIIIIALIVLGPKDLAKTGKTIGKWLNDLVKSDTWKIMQNTTKELRRLPTELMRDDNLEKFLTEEQQKSPVTGDNAGTWSGKVGTAVASLQAKSSIPTGETPVASNPTPAPEPKNENTILPPVIVDSPPAPKLKPTPRKSATTTLKKETPAKQTTTKSEKKPVTRKKPNA